MSYAIDITYCKSLKLKSGSSANTIFVHPSNNLMLIVSRLNPLLVARGDSALNYNNVELVINDTTSGYKKTLTGNDTLESKGFKPITEKDKRNSATLRAKGADSGGCIIM
ncbi:hypothetical protein LPJ77_004902 [Coemansia sp. RSA 2523]|nr:hypothetical protein LPJ54_004671 [Coemansia sp. RSA 1824]KAJ1784266.1 hypothetical protein LPJ62_004710 [Coemansia sp. RSA 2167]KAJ1804162.1 hypothetical protein LPJ77_004902 [Coemansia sp. RSA 2523]KAJ2168039.1 hypothetical protein GGH15_001690 [Coemansia sp. RSA 562]KAJ2180112.1 hypothetical protein EV181_005673 [Coemansia sp. RSA 532]KAJ2274499.1 hypothetical protein J3F81_002215 [Coemansia sp. RSA 371]KAJ2294818.1 hypothetical protein IW141_000100 [Coemansia sp. RSA 355]KAJ2555378.1 